MIALRSILFWIFIIAMTLLVSLPILICSTLLLPFNPNKTWAHAIGNFWGWSIFKINPGWKVTIEGKERFTKKPSVIICNHESLSDIIALYLLGVQFKWLAKRSLFKVPFFGWSMALSGHIPLERGSLKSARESFDRAKECLKRGSSVLIFPEGTRSRHGGLADFKAGAFKLALQNKVPINCIAITGTRDIIQKGSWKIVPKIHIKMRVLPPLLVDELEKGDETELMAAARDGIQSALDELKQRP